MVGWCRQAAQAGPILSKTVIELEVNDIYAVFPFLFTPW